MNKEALVTASVLEVVRHGFSWNADAHLDIGVAKQDRPSGDGIALGLESTGLEMTHPHHFGLDILGLGRVELGPACHLGRWMDVIDRRCGADESLRSEDFLRVENAVGSTELDMSLWRNVAELGVVGHGRISEKVIVRCAGIFRSG